MAAWWARPAADKGWPGDQARPRGLKPRAAAAAAARRVPSRWQRSSRAAGDRLLSGAGDQAGGCSGLQGGEPRGGAGWHLHLGPSSQSTPIYPVRRLISMRSITLVKSSVMLLGQYDTWSVSRPNMPPFRARTNNLRAVGPRPGWFTLGACVTVARD